MRRSCVHPTHGLLALALPLLVALLFTAPLAAQEIALTYDVIALEEHGDVLQARVSLTAVNTSGQDLTNVNARAAGDTFLAEGVVQFAAIATGEARTLDATFVFRAERWANDESIALQIEFEDATGVTHEQEIDVRNEEEGS